MKNIIKTLLILTLFSCNSTDSIQSNQNTQNQDDTVLNQVETVSQVDNNLTFKKYCNERYGYCIDYPEGIIYPQPESFNGDGRVFKNKLGQEILNVFGRNNYDPEFGNISLEQQFNDDLHGLDQENNNNRVITYQKLGKTFFVISGYNNGKIFYQKTILKDEAFAYAILQYNEADKATFDQVSERIFKSFK